MHQKKLSHCLILLRGNTYNCAELCGNTRVNTSLFIEYLEAFTLALKLNHLFHCLLLKAD